MTSQGNNHAKFSIDIVHQVEEIKAKQNTQRSTQLLIASRNGDTEALSILIEAGGDATSTIQDGTTAGSGMFPSHFALSRDYVNR